MVCALIFGGGQFLRALKTTQGVSVSWFGCWEVFLALNLVLAFKAHRNKPSRGTVMTLITYCVWVVLVTLNLAVMFVRHTAVWNLRDTIVVTCCAIGTFCTLMIANSKRLTIMDPMVKGYLAIFFKAIPQVALGINILIMGGSGLAASTVWNGHLTIFIRLGQLHYSIKEAGWDRNRIGSAISELGNEVSWIITTILWLIANHH